MLGGVRCCNYRVYLGSTHFPCRRHNPFRGRCLRPLPNGRSSALAAGFRPRAAAHCGPCSGRGGGMVKGNGMHARLPCLRIVAGTLQWCMWSCPCSSPAPKTFPDVSVRESVTDRCSRGMWCFLLPYCRGSWQSCFLPGAFRCSPIRLVVVGLVLSSRTKESTSTEPFIQSVVVQTCPPECWRSAFSTPTARRPGPHTHWLRCDGLNTVPTS